MIPSPVPAKPTRTKVTNSQTVIIDNQNLNVNVNGKPAETSNTSSTSSPAEGQVESGNPPVVSASDISKGTEAQKTDDPVQNEVVEEQRPVTQQVRTLILGDSEEIAEYHKQIHAQDPRKNMLSISIAPAYYYNGSASSYSFRRYTANGPGFGLGMNFWATPFFGIQSRFFSSVGGSVRSGGTNMVPLEVQNLNVGIRFRKHFGYSRKAPHLTWGLDYHDSHTKISRDALTAVGHKSNGVSVALDGVVPQSVTYAHTFQIDIQPRLKHSETTSGVQVTSGSKSETTALSLGLGGQWTLDRQNQVFWKGQYSVERNLFEGAASTVDPHNSITPSGVSVTDSLLIFYFGFRWGS